MLSLKTSRQTNDNKAKGRRKSRPSLHLKSHILATQDVGVDRKNN